MKKIILMLAVAIIFCTFSCRKASSYFINDETPDLKGVMTLIRGCDGDWLEFEGKAYNICNYRTVSKFEEGTKLVAGINKGCDYNKYPGREVCTIGRTNGGGTVTIVSLQPVK